MFLTELRIISHGKDGKSHGKSHEKSWNFLQLKKYEPCCRICMGTLFSSLKHAKSIVDRSLLLRQLWASFVIKAEKKRVDPLFLTLKVLWEPEVLKSGTSFETKPQ